MSESKYTPGPWTANLHHLQDYTGRSHAFIHATKPLVPLAAVVLAAKGCDDAEGRANARLIAAAPHLLEVLQLVAKGLRQGAIPDQTLLTPGKDDSCLDMTPLSKIVNDAIGTAIAKEGEEG